MLGPKKAGFLPSAAKAFTDTCRGLLTAFVTSSPATLPPFILQGHLEGAFKKQIRSYH